MSANNSSAGSGPRLLVVQCEADFRLRLRYDDGTEGTVDLSGEIHRGGVFAALEDRAAFSLAAIGEFGQIEWPNGIAICPNALYLRLTKKTPGELFPDLSEHAADA